MAVVITVAFVMDAIPSSTGAYAHVAYWERRFEKEQGHEWFGGYAEFRHLLKPHISPAARILILGNGTSRLPSDLEQDGYRGITATDICPNVVQKMQCRYRTLSLPLHHMTSDARHASVVFEVADMCALPYEDGRFDVVIEKGTLDVLFAEAPSLWQPPASVCERMDTACKEIRRVLSPTGLFFSITFTQPHFRGPFFTSRMLLPWALSLVNRCPSKAAAGLVTWIHLVRRDVSSTLSIACPRRRLLCHSNDQRVPQRRRRGR